MKPRFRTRGYIPFVRYFLRDVFLFQRQGYSWGAAIRAAFDYWKHDRAAERPWE